MNTPTWLISQLDPDGQEAFGSWLDELQKHPYYYGEMAKYAESTMSPAKYTRWERQLLMTPIYKYFQSFLTTYNEFRQGLCAESAMPAGYEAYIEFINSEDAESNLIELRRMIQPKILKEPAKYDIELPDMELSDRTGDFLRQLAQMVQHQVLCDVLHTLVTEGIEVYAQTSEVQAAIRIVDTHHFRTHGHDMESWFAYAYPSIMEYQGVLLSYIHAKDWLSFYGTIRELRANLTDHQADINWLLYDINRDFF